MRLSQRSISSLLLTALLTSTAEAQVGASTLAQLGDTQHWMIACAAFALALFATLVMLLRSRLQLGAHRRRIDELKRELSHHHRTATILKEAHEELELRVRDRTADLEMSYQKLNDVRDSLHAANERLDSLARVDELTGVANQRQLHETLATEIKRTLRSRQPVSLIVAELDFFEKYRRTYGRDRADAALRKVAAQVEKTFKRAPDTVARHGDHSFAVVLPETDTRDAMRFGERLREVVWENCLPFPESEVADRVTASVGLATMQPDKLYSTNDLLEAAGRALTAARQSGHNAVEYGSVVAVTELEASEA